jgi:hypothetical protein
MTREIQDNVTITPELASKWLKNNADNRPINRDAVSRLANEMLSGRWSLCSTAITLGAGDCVVDGQHRLSAVVKSGCSIQAILVTDDSIQSPRMYRGDHGQSRTGAYMYGFNTPVWSAASALAAFTLCTTRTYQNQGHVIIEKFAKALGPVHALLTSTTKAGRTRAPQRAAVCVCLLMYPNRCAEIAEQYSKLVNADHAGMWPAIDALEKQLVERQIRQQRDDDFAMFARTYRAFSYGISGKSVSKLTLKNADTVIADVRDDLKSLGVFLAK